MSVLLKGSKVRSDKQIKVIAKRQKELNDFMHKHKLNVKSVAEFLALCDGTIYAYLSGRIFMADIYWNALKQQKIGKK
jgi:hypothetical protein